VAVCGPNDTPITRTETLVRHTPASMATEPVEAEHQPWLDSRAWGIQVDNFFQRTAAPGSQFQDVPIGKGEYVVAELPPLVDPERGSTMGDAGVAGQRARDLMVSLGELMNDTVNPALNPQLAGMWAEGQ